LNKIDRNMKVQIRNPKGSRKRGKQQRGMRIFRIRAGLSLSGKNRTGGEPLGGLLTQL
jgi:hypothetical protein